jgi:Family of unknown function (DUF5715)
MRRLHFVFFSALVLFFISGLAHTAFAAATRTGASRPHARHLRAAASTRRVRTSAHSSRSTRVAHSRSRSRAMIASRRRPARIQTQQPEVAETVPAIPMKHWTILPALVGSRESLVRQNQRTESDGLARIEDDAQLNELRRTKALVPLPANGQLRVNEGLPANRRYCRPWTAKFLADLARAHTMRFHRSMQVNSAVRTVAYQRSLIAVNGNAAPAEGDVASPHLTGATIDIAKKGLSMSEVSWMRAYLLPLEQAGKIDVEEEFYQSCFHITVYKSYVPAAGPSSRASSTLLAATVK